VKHLKAVKNLLTVWIYIYKLRKRKQRKTLSTHPFLPHLQINIAKRSCNRAHQIPHPLAPSPRLARRIAHLNRGIERGIGRRRHVQESTGASNALCAEALGDVEVLPDPPDAVDLRVVEVEGWVAGGDEEVAAWVAAEGVVACERKKRKYDDSVEGGGGAGRGGGFIGKS